MILIATPTHGQIEAWTASDVLQLSKHSPDTDWAFGFGTYVNNNRTLLVHAAVKANVSHILFIDSDMRFPPNTLERLLSHKKDIVGANYKQRTNDSFTTWNGKEFITSKDKSGIEEVESIGFGCVLIDMNVFSSKLRSVPVNCFSMPFDTSLGVFVGEDVYFCTIARDKGFKVWVDHDLSQEVRHIASYEKGI